MDLVPMQVATSQSGDPRPFFDMQVTVDGVTYTLAFRWNTRALAFFMTTYDETGQTLLLGDWRVVVDYPIAIWVTGRPTPGVFIFADTSGFGADPGLGDLGRRVQLYYVPAADLAPLTT